MPQRSRWGERCSRLQGESAFRGGVPLPIRDAGSLTGLLNANMVKFGTVIVMNHGHENDVTGLIEEGGKSSFLLADPL